MLTTTKEIVIILACQTEEKVAAMKNDKQYYKELPKVNGYKWILFDCEEGLHYFQKGSNRKGYMVLKLEEGDIEEINSYNFMLENDLTR